MEGHAERAGMDKKHKICEYLNIGYNIKLKRNLFLPRFVVFYTYISHITDILTENLMYRYNIFSPVQLVQHFSPVHRFTGTGIYSLIVYYEGS